MAGTPPSAGPGAGNTSRFGSLFTEDSVLSGDAFNFSAIIRLIHTFIKL